MEKKTPRLEFNYIYSHQTQKEVAINEGFLKIDSLLLNGVVSRTTTTPPSVPSIGQIYIIPKNAVGAWSWDGGIDYLVCNANNTWNWIKPRTGMLFWIADEASLCVYDGAIWRSLAISYTDGILGLGTKIGL